MAETILSNFPTSLDDTTSLLNDVVNLKSFVLSGAHTSAVTTITTTATITGITAPNYLLIDSEVIHFTGISGTGFTGCTRGADGTTAASHVDASTIYHVVAANYHNQLRRAIIAIETELGTNPSGASADVAAAITAATVAAATQAEMEAESLTTVYGSPGRVKFAPSAAKAWGFITISAGVPTLVTSYNTTSITDNGAGLMQVTIATDFSSASYAVVTAIQYQRGVDEPTWALVNIGTGGAAQAAGTFDLAIRSATDVTDGYRALYFACFGDQ